MLRFINGNDTQFAWLRDEIQGRLFIFNDISLPHSCTPHKCRLGFEFTPANGYKFYIDKNIAFSGNHQDFTTFLSSGEASFDTYDDMVRFIKGFDALYDGAGGKSSNCSTEGISHESQSNNEQAKAV